METAQRNWYSTESQPNKQANKQTDRQTNNKQSKQLLSSMVYHFLKKSIFAMENQIFVSILNGGKARWALDPHPKVPVGSFDPSSNPVAQGAWRIGGPVGSWRIIDDHLRKPNGGKHWVDSNFVFFQNWRQDG